MNRLKNAIEGLAAAALEFEEAATQEHRRLRAKHRTTDGWLTAEGKLYHLVEEILQGHIYTSTQQRAIQGAWSAWRPQLNKSAQTLPWQGRSGGAA